MTKIQIELLRWDDVIAGSDRSMTLLEGVRESERRYPTMQPRALALASQGRLREAALPLEDAEGMNELRGPGLRHSGHLHLEAGNPRAALEVAAHEFEISRIETHSNLLPENQGWRGAALGHRSTGDDGRRKSDSDVP